MDSIPLMTLLLPALGRLQLARQLPDLHGRGLIRGMGSIGGGSKLGWVLGMGTGMGMCMGMGMGMYLLLQVVLLGEQMRLAARPPRLARLLIAGSSLVRWAHRREAHQWD